jgi:hypothetical protein
VSPLSSGKTWDGDVMIQKTKTYFRRSSAEWSDRLTPPSVPFLLPYINSSVCQHPRSRPEDGDSVFFRNIRKFLRKYMASRLKTTASSSSTSTLLSSHLTVRYTDWENNCQIGKTNRWRHGGELNISNYNFMCSV